MQAIVAACGDGRLKATAVGLVSNNSKSKAVAFAHQHGIPVLLTSGDEDRTQNIPTDAITRFLSEVTADLIVLSGYMKLLPPAVVHEFPGRIFNIHPGLLPKFGGKGMFGIHVHRAVIAAGERESGITIHEVNERYDEGRIVAERRVPVLADDTAETLEARIRAEEPAFFVETLIRMQGGGLSV